MAARIAVKELLSITTLGAGLVLFLARLSTLGGIHTLLYDSDSLTMPLFARALHAPEGMGWISGPFLGLFPELPTYLLAIPQPEMERRLRLGEPPIITRVEKGQLLIDLRTVFPHEEQTLLSALLIRAVDR